MRYVRRRLKLDRHLRLTIAAPSLAQMAHLAWSQFPLETGGVLLGRAHETDVQVEHVIGPGPGATHERYRFTPDAAWQANEVADLWSADNTVAYLGDWHTHPEGTTRLSDLDAQTARDIAASQAARQPTPVMMVVALSRQGLTEIAAARFANGRIVPMRVQLRD